MFAERIVKLRKAKKMTQEQLADTLGISRAALSHYENGRREPDFQSVVKFAEFFGVSTDYLLGQTDDPTPPQSVHEEAIKYLSEHGEPVDGFKLVPVLGSIHAGEPVPPLDQTTEWYPAPKNRMKPGKQYFYLRVRGDCMAGGRNPIYDGYLVLVESTPEVPNGKIAVVMLPDEDEAVLRRVWFVREGVILTADNPQYEPIFVDGQDIKIYGHVVKVEFEPAAAKEVRNHIHMEGMP